MMLRLTTTDGMQVEVTGTVVESKKGRRKEHHVWIKDRSFLPITVNEDEDTVCLQLTPETAARVPPLATVTRVDAPGRLGLETAINPRLSWSGSPSVYLWVSHGVYTPADLLAYSESLRQLAGRSQ
jgi:hypothetical protein